MPHPPIDVVALDCSPTSNRLCISCISTSLPRGHVDFLALVGCCHHIYLTSMTQGLVLSPHSVPNQTWQRSPLIFASKITHICRSNVSYLPLKGLIFAKQIRDEGHWSQWPWVALGCHCEKRTGIVAILVRSHAVLPYNFASRSRSSDHLKYL